jgi:hypothetical protein
MDEEGKAPIARLANASTLDSLLDPSWLANNGAAIELLSQVFGFDELELRLLSAAPDAATRKELRDGLAKLVEAGGANVELYEIVAQEMQDRQKRASQIDQCRKLGLAVQAAIKEAFERHGLKLELVDRGFDYEVTSPTDDLLEEAAAKLEMGPYLLEVKATTTGGARLTPAQALMASQRPESYVLCVVDLRSVAAQDLAADWTAEMVLPLARIVSDVGAQVSETCQYIDAAKSSLVGIRNESALRYEVPAEAWLKGNSIESWVSKVFAKNLEAF